MTQATDRPRTEVQQGEDSALAPKPFPQLRRFREWCEDKRERRCYESENGETYQHPVEHSYSYKAERQRFARFKDVERWFLDEYDTLTTVLLTYTCPRSEGETVVEHAKSFYPRTITRKRRDCLKATGRWDEYAGVSLLAPKDVAPTPTAQATHAHDFLLIPGFASSECFDPLREREGVDVSIRYHRSDKVQAPPSVNRADLERERGATTALSQEVGANLPGLAAIDGFRDMIEVDATTNSARHKAALDATDCPAYVERWCARMSCGEDGDPATNGVRRWRPLGRFSEIADLMKGERGYGSEDGGAKVESEDGEPADRDQNAPPNREDTTLSDEERAFVTEYVEADLPPDKDVIASNVEDNINALGGIARVDVLVEAIQEQL